MALLMPPPGVPAAAACVASVAVALAPETWSPAFSIAAVLVVVVDVAACTPFDRGACA